MDLIIIIAISVLGGASIAGGFVGYRRSLTTGAKVVSAAGVAAGLVMWLVLLFVVPVSSSTGVGEQAQPQPIVETTVMPDPSSGSAGAAIKSTGMTLESFEDLLTLEDIKSVSPIEDLDSEITDYKEQAGRVDPAQVQDIRSWYGFTASFRGGNPGLTMTVIDFDSVTAASRHYEFVAGDDLLPMDSTVGDLSALAEFNSQGIGSMLVFIQGNAMVSVHTTVDAGQPPLMTRENLEEMANLVSGRLGTDG